MISTPYDDIAGQLAAARVALRPKEVEHLALLLEPLKGGGVLLDLGCGTGHPIATYLASRGHAVVGVDGSVAMLDVARARLPDHRWVHDFMERVFGLVMSLSWHRTEERIRGYRAALRDVSA